MKLNRTGSHYILNHPSNSKLTIGIRLYSVVDISHLNIPDFFHQHPTCEKKSLSKFGENLFRSFCVILLSNPPTNKRVDTVQTTCSLELQSTFLQNAGCLLLNKALHPSPLDAYPISEIVYTWKKGPLSSVEVPQESSSLLQYDLIGQTVSSERLKSNTGEQRAEPRITWVQSSVKCVLRLKTWSGFHSSSETQIWVWSVVSALDMLSDMF